MSLTPIRTPHVWAWVCACALLASACGRLGDFQENAEREEKTAQVTTWSGRFEIFIEHRLLVAHAPTQFTTHVTDLVSLEPRREGPLTFILRHDSEAPITHVEPTPARAGIYLPGLTFSAPGEWRLSLLIPLAGHEYPVELPPFTVFASPQEVARAPEPTAPEGISFLKEQQWKVQTKTDPVARQTVVERLRLAGVVTVRPGHKAAVVPPVPGHVATPPGRPWPPLGSRVEAGQVLALLQPRLVGSDLVTFINIHQQIQA